MAQLQMIPITLESIKSGRRISEFVAGEDNALNSTRRERWVLDFSGDRYKFQRWDDRSRGHSGHSSDRMVQIREFLRHDEWNVELYAFQSKDEMEQWLNRP